MTGSFPPSQLLHDQQRLLTSFCFVPFSAPASKNLKGAIEWTIGEPVARTNRDDAVHPIVFWSACLEHRVHAEVVACRIDGLTMIEFLHDLWSTRAQALVGHDDQSAIRRPLSATVVATLPSGSTNLDITITADGKFLYTLNSGTGTINIFGINQDGSLTSLGDVGGLSANAGMNGIAAI